MRWRSASGTSGRAYTEADLRFAEVLCGRLALALDNATLSRTVTGLERRLEVTLANLAEAVLVREADGRIVFANSATARLLRLASPEHVTNAVPGSLMALYDVFDESGRRVTLADLPSAAARVASSPIRCSCETSSVRRVKSAGWCTRQRPCSTGTASCRSS